MYFMSFQLKIVNKKMNLNLKKNSRLYAELKARALSAEMEVLQSMGFELYSFIKTAHIYLMYIYKNLKFSRQLFEMSWTMLNDVYASFLVSVIPPHLLAVAAIMIAYRKTKEPMPAVPWWVLYEVQEKDIQVVIKAILRFYGAKTNNWDLEKLKKLFKIAKWSFKEDMNKPGSLAIKEVKEESLVKEKKRDKKSKKNKKEKKKDKKSKKSKKEKKKDKRSKKKYKDYRNDVNKYKERSKNKLKRRDDSREGNRRLKKREKYYSSRDKMRSKDNRYKSGYHHKE
jgi:outer membrane biosynthesis protein TonB